MKVFVTGAAGFVGNAVVRSLLARGHEAIGLVIDKRDAVKVERVGGQAVCGDLRTAEGLAIAAGNARSADGVIHCTKSFWPETLEADAARRGELIKRETEEWESVDLATLNVVLDALEGTGKPFVFSSSSSVFSDTGDAIFDEDSPVPETATYGSWRIRHERLVLQAASRNIRTVAMRCAMIFGPHPDDLPLGRPHPANMHQQLADRDSVGYLLPGDHLNTAVHVDAYADLYVLALEKAAPGSVFIGGTEDYTPKTFALALSYAYGYGGRIRGWTREEAAAVLGEGTAMKFLQDRIRTTSAKAKRVLGWQPKAPSLMECAMEEARRRYGAIST